MATLEETGTGGRRVQLGQRTRFGRHDDSDVRLEGPRISREHALIHWTRRGWALRDLGSRNGTFLEGARLEPGRDVPLAEGLTVTFGGPDIAWRVADLAAPAPVATCLDDGARVEADGGILAVPDPDRPAVTLFAQGDGLWTAETDVAQWPVRTGDELVVLGKRWQVTLPEAAEDTLEAAEQPLHFDEVRLRIGVTRDEEHVELTLSRGNEHRTLTPRAHLYLVATLARLRLQDTEQADAETERGWVDREALCRMLAIDPSRLNTDVHRARRQLADAGVVAAHRLIERRPGGQLRLGTEQVEVVAI